MKERILQINQLIKRELSQIILREIEFPLDVLATITRVETTRKIDEAKVYVSCLPESKAKLILNILNRCIYRLQQLLNKRLRMRPIPRIVFIEEKETIKAGRIEEILEKIKIEK
ncbi:MAG: 30S ribosome-binding factor RbfA [bacterium]|nr:30S ribosome-binding factor RbfA [bacterium]